MSVAATSEAGPAALVVAGGLAVAVAVAAAVGIPGDDAAVLIASSFGVALVAYALGRAALRRSRSPVVVALIPVAAVALGSLAVSRWAWNRSLASYTSAPS